MTLLQLLDVLTRRQRRTFVLVTLVAFACATAVTLSLPKEYRGVATLFVGENRDLSASVNAVQLDDVLARTYAELLEQPTLQREVARRLPDVPAGTLDETVSVEVVPGTRLLRISALDQDPEQARTIVNTYAEVFVATQETSLSNTSRGRLDRLNRRIGELARERATLAPEDASRRAQIDNELESFRQTFRAVQESAAQQGSNVSVSSLSLVPKVPAKPRTKVYLVLGLVLSLLFGGLAALIRNTFDRRVRDEDELLDLLGGAQVLARIPVGRSPREQRAMNEAFDFLRVNLRLSAADFPVRTVAVTSSLAGDGKSTVCAQLARAFARQGSSVIAMDCDLRKPMLSTYLGVSGTRGVTNGLVTGSAALDLVQDSDTPGVQVIPSGPIPPNPAVLLGLPRFGQMVDSLRVSADHVVVDTPPVPAGVDASTVAQSVDGILLVVDLNRSDRQALKAAYEQLTQVNARVLGVVLNRVPDRSMPYGYGADYGTGVRLEESAGNVPAAAR